MNCRVCNKPISKTDCGLPLCDSCPTPPDMLAGQQLLLGIEKQDRARRRNWEAGKLPRRGKRAGKGKGK